jgi:hypothetical protein
MAFPRNYPLIPNRLNAIFTLNLALSAIPEIFGVASGIAAALQITLRAAEFCPHSSPPPAPFQGEAYTKSLLIVKVLIIFSIS